jgi:hypothetical protein
LGNPLAVTIPLTAEQSRELIDAIATAASVESLAELQVLARREHLLHLRGGFLELLIAVRLDTLTRTRVTRDKVS